MLLFSLSPHVFAASDEANQAANALHELGLFQGMGTDENGNPNYNLDQVPTRNQAVIMLVRLLGKETEAKGRSWDIPFTDVSDSVRPYVGYAYSTGLTSGTSKTTFSGTSPISVSQYVTFILRALGYESGKDFHVSSALELSDKIGLTNGQYSGSSEFTRGDVAVLSYRALSQKSKNANVTLIQSLSSCSAVRQGAVLTNLLSSYGGLDYYSEYSRLPKVENVNLRAVLEKDRPSSGTLYYAYEYSFDYEYEANLTCDLYCSLLLSQGFSVQDAARPYFKAYKVTVPSTGKTFDIFITQISEGEPYDFLIRFPIDDVTIPDDTQEPAGAKPVTEPTPAPEPEPEPEPVTKPATKPVIRISIDCEDPFIGPGEEITLTASTYPGDADADLTWETDRPECTSVEDGVVTMFAEGSGSAKITATASNGVFGYTYIFLTRSKDKGAVKDADGLRYYLRNKYTNLETPVGNLILSLTMNISQEYPDKPLFAYVSVDFHSEEFAPNNDSLGIAQRVTPLTFTGVGYSREEERAAYEMLQDLQRDIYQDIIDCFPDAQAKGDISVTGYHYPYIEVGYWKQTTLSWNNYDGGFQWVPSIDTFELIPD